MRENFIYANDVLRHILVVMTLSALTACGQTDQAGHGNRTSAEGRPAPDILERELGRESVEPASAWIKTQASRFRMLLGTTQCEILVVPVQNEGFGFDRATRWIMGAQLAAQLSIGDDRCVVDPLLADRALGEGRRRISDVDIDTLAGMINARVVIRIYVGHDKAFRMHVTADVRGGPNASVLDRLVMPKRRYWDSIQFSDSTPPFVAWNSILPAVVEMVGAPKDALNKPPN